MASDLATINVASLAVREDRPDRDALLGRRLLVIVTIDALIYLLIIADMVLKPFGS